MDYEAATNKSTDYIYLGDVRIAQKEKTGTAAAIVSYLHNDLLGSPILSTNATGTTLWKETYQPYGAPHVKSVGKAGRQTGYLGKPYEEATGLSYLGARYYNPVLGRFLSIDPVGVVPSNVHSQNRYAYGNNNPLTYKDPQGTYGEYVDSRNGGIPSLGALQSQANANLEVALKTWWRRLNEPKRADVLNLPSNIQAVYSIGYDIGINNSLGQDPSSSNSSNIGFSEATSTGMPQPPNDDDDLTKSEKKEIRSLTKRIEEHELKIKEFKANPTVRPGMEKLPKEIIEKQQLARIRHLQQEIRAFQGRIDFIKNKGNSK